MSAGWLAMPLQDNLDLAHLAVAVAPGERRRGHGSAMLVHREAEARGAGRTVLGPSPSGTWAPAPTRTASPAPPSWSTTASR